MDLVFVNINPKKKDRVDYFRDRLHVFGCGITFLLTVLGKFCEKCLGGHFLRDHFGLNQVIEEEKHGIKHRGVRGWK